MPSPENSESLSPALGLYGGTFDPIHLGHTLPVQQAAEKIGLQQVRIIPCHIPPHRQTPSVGAEHRWAMVQLACNDYPLFIADDCELKRDKPSYSFDTLKNFRQAMPNTPLLFFMGQDAFNGLQSWYRWQELLTLCHIVVCARPGYDFASNTELKRWATPFIIKDSQLLHQQLAGHIYFIESQLLAVSSTELRRQLAENTLLPAQLDENVGRYIQQHHLYRKTSSS